MDVDDETKKLKRALVFLLIFAFSSFLAWGELMFLVAGRTADAQVTHVERVEKRKRFNTVETFVVSVVLRR